MNYTYSSFKYPSSDQKNTITAHIFTPNAENIKGIIQISHGMVDHIQRYGNLIEYFTGIGYVVAGNDHLGHGDSVKSENDLGYFAPSRSIEYILKDLHTLNKRLREMFPPMKPVLLGHSMGSFLSRLYAEKYPNSISGHIIHGTGGPMGAILPMGKALVATVALFRGKRHRSKFIKSIAFMGYNSKFPKEEGSNAWLSRDASQISQKALDPKASFTFTVSAYRDLFSMVGCANSKKWFREYPKSMKTMILSGDMDPVGKYGKGPRYVYKRLLVHGTQDLTIKLYNGARHELFNETCRNEVFTDMENWLSGVFK